MKLSRLLKCVSYECMLYISTANGEALRRTAGEVPFWMTQRRILSTLVTDGQLNVIVEE